MKIRKGRFLNKIANKIITSPRFRTKIVISKKDKAEKYKLATLYKEMLDEC